MKDQQKGFPLRGYMLFPTALVHGYRGVDRNPFVPVLVEEAMDPNPPMLSDISDVWRFYPPGWRRDAYRLYEENLVAGTGDQLDILNSKDIAREIMRIIEPHAGLHEIVSCEIWDMDLISRIPERREPNFLGYDVAYLGGDFFSAVRAGMFGSPWFDHKHNPNLIQEFKTTLNKFGLFASTSPVMSYVQRFKQEAPSEDNAEFYVWALEVVE